MFCMCELLIKKAFSDAWFFICVWLCFVLIIWKFDDSYGLAWGMCDDDIGPLLVFRFRLLTLVMLFLMLESSKM